MWSRRIVAALFASVLLAGSPQAARSAVTATARRIDAFCDGQRMRAGAPSATFVSIYDGSARDGIWRRADAAALARIAHDPDIYSEIARVRYAAGRIAVVEIVADSLDFGARTEYCFRPGGTLARASERSSGTTNADRELRYLDREGRDVGRSSRVTLVDPHASATPSPELRPARVALFLTVRDLPFYRLIAAP